MKKQIVLLLFLGIAGLQAANSQETKGNEYIPLIQENKIWNVVTIYTSYELWETKYTTEKLSFFGDTVINDIQYKKLYTSPKEQPEFPQDWTLIRCMREDENKKVWDSYGRLIYDFSLEIGDTVAFNECHEAVVVDNITYETMLNGEERKVWHLSAMCNYSPYDSNGNEYWIEGIGSRAGLISPLTGECVTGALNSLLCYYDNDELIFNANFRHGDCYLNFQVDIAETIIDDQINIYPNPANDILNIKVSENEKIKAISIRSIDGKLIEKHQEALTQLSIGNLKAGVYFVEIETDRGNFKKLVIKE